MKEQGPDKTDGSPGQPEKNGNGKGKPSNISSKDLKNVTLPVQQYGNPDESKIKSSKLPMPSFRMIGEYKTEAADAPGRRTAYYRYIEKPVEELAEEVKNSYFMYSKKKGEYKKYICYTAMKIHHLSVTNTA